MKKLSLLLISISIAILSACNNQDKIADEANASPEDTVVALPDTLNTSEQPSSNPGDTTTSMKQAATAEGLNPAHGMPGHRCEIAVGAPLSSAPSAAPAAINTGTPADQNTIHGSTTIQVPSTSTPVQAPASIMTSPSAGTPATAAPATTAPGMNPPHGQPGHDCAIAVGAPLKK